MRENNRAGLGPAVALHRFLDELQGGRLVAGLGHEGFQDLALTVDGAPQVAHLAAIIGLIG